MSEELKTLETKPAESEVKPVEVEKITNEKELSREQKTAVKKLKEYSREAKKHMKQNQTTQKEQDDEDQAPPSGADDQQNEENTQKESKISVNTFLAFGTILIGLAGLYIAHKNYLMNQIKAGKHDDVIKIQPAPKKNPKFRTL